MSDQRISGAAHASTESTLGGLVHDLSQQLPELIRSELRLAQAEVAEKGKRAGLGIGLFSGAGLLAFFGFGTLVATAVIALSNALPAWLSGVIVAVVLFAAAGIVAVLGKGQVQQATPPKPERAIEGLKEDVATVKSFKESHH
ncbi:phage holin family protein [Nocardioides bigeumensis]|uniref:Phage holin family protein n=1 Tax=Nocardioides bigeumensis TaxID=433657 RepID=A0ABN2Y725_9ACTN